MIKEKIVQRSKTVKRLIIYHQIDPKRPNKNANVLVHIPEEFDKEELREITLTIKKALKERFPFAEVYLAPKIASWVQNAGN